jgi:hypothetical protein
MACKDQDTGRIVKEIFETCINDTEPFIDIP